MSNIKNDGLTRSGWHRMLYSCTRMATVGVKGLNKHLNVIAFLQCNLLYQQKSFSLILHPLVLGYFPVCASFNYHILCVSLYY